MQEIRVSSKRKSEHLCQGLHANPPQYWQSSKTNVAGQKIWPRDKAREIKWPVNEAIVGSRVSFPNWSGHDVWGGGGGGGGGGF